MSEQRKRRWNVERPDGGFDDVGAYWLTLSDGALWFHNSTLSPVDSLCVIYAPRTWITVTQGNDQ